MNKTIIFLFFLSSLILIPSIYSFETNFSQNTFFYYNEDIDLGLTNLPTNASYVNLEITSSDSNITYYAENLGIQEIKSDVFSFTSIYPEIILVNYSVFDVNGSLISKSTYPINLVQSDLIFNYSLCNSKDCSDKVGNTFNANENIYLVSSMKDETIDYNITVINEYGTDINLINKKLPLQLGFYAADYTLNITADVNNKKFTKNLSLSIVDSSVNSDLNQAPSDWDLYFAEVGNTNPVVKPIDNNKPVTPIIQPEKNSNLIPALLFAVIVLLVIILIFNYRSKARKQNQGNRRENSKERNLKGFFFIVFAIILLLFLFPNISADKTDQTYEYQNLEIDYQTLQNMFTYDNNINLYITPDKLSTEVYYPIVLDFLMPGTYPTMVTDGSQKDGTLNYEVLDSLLVVDPKKTMNNLNDFSLAGLMNKDVPTAKVSSACSDVLDFYKNNPIRTKIDLIKREKSSLVNNERFDSTCITELINKRYLHSEPLLLKLNYTDLDNNFGTEKTIKIKLIVSSSSGFMGSQTYNINVNYLNLGTINYVPTPDNYDLINYFASDKGFNLENISSSTYKELSTAFEFNPDKYALNKSLLGIKLMNYHNCVSTFNFTTPSSAENILYDNTHTSDFTYTTFGDVNFNTNINYYLINNNCDSVNNKLNLNVYNLTNSTVKEKFSIPTNTNKNNLFHNKELDLIIPTLDVSDSEPYELYLNKTKQAIMLKNSQLLYLAPDFFKGSDKNNMNLYVLDISNKNDFKLLTYSSAYNKENYSYSLSKNNITLVSFQRNVNGITYTLNIDDQIISISTGEELIYNKKYSIKINKDKLVVKNIVYFNNSDTYQAPLVSSIDYEKMQAYISNYLAGKAALDFSTNNYYQKLNDSDINEFNYDIFDISNIYNFNPAQRDLFWSDLAYKTDFGTTNTVSSIYNLYCGEAMDDRYVQLRPYLNLTSPNKAKEYFLSDLKYNYILKNSFTINDYNLLCSSLLNKSKYEQRFASYFILGASFMDAQDSKSNNEGLEVDQNKIATKTTLNFVDSSHLNESLENINYYLAMRALMITPLSNQSLFVKTNYININDYASLDFKFPKRKSTYNENIIAKFIGSTQYNGLCSKFSRIVSTDNYNYGTNSSLGDISWPQTEDGGYPDAWTLAKYNQSIWNSLKDKPINQDHIMDGSILGIFLSTHNNENHSLKSTQYSHVVLFVDNFKGKQNSILSAEDKVYHQTLDELLSKPHTYGFYKLREVILPKGFYDTTIKDEFGKTELDYAKEYLVAQD